VPPLSLELPGGSNVIPISVDLEAPRRRRTLVIEMGNDLGLDEPEAIVADVESRTQVLGRVRPRARGQLEIAGQQGEYSSVRVRDRRRGSFWFHFAAVRLPGGEVLRYSMTSKRLAHDNTRNFIGLCENIRLAQPEDTGPRMADISFDVPHGLILKTLTAALMFGQGSNQDALTIAASATGEAVGPGIDESLEQRAANGGVLDLDRRPLDLEHATGEEARYRIATQDTANRAEFAERIAELELPNGTTVVLSLRHAPSQVEARERFWQALLQSVRPFGTTHR